MMTSAKTHPAEAAPASVVINGESHTLHGAVSKNDGQKRSRLESHSPHVLRQREVDCVQKTVGQTKELYQKTLATKYLEWVEKNFPSCKET